MKEKRILNILGQVDEKYIEEAAPAKKEKKKRIWMRWGGIAACLVLVVAFGIRILNNNQNTLELTDDSHGVTVKYTRNAPRVSTSYDLASLTEEEIFAERDTAIFKGTVTKIDNIEMDFNGNKDYRAVVEMKVEKGYRGDLQEKDTVSVLLPCPILEGIWVEDTETVSAIKVGMTGIFMPMVYDSTSVREENGATLALKDVADYGFADGSRYAFLETQNGLIFAKWAYASIADATTLEQIEEYVIGMIESTK